MTGEWRVNHEHNGVEVSFPGKPDAATIASLKANGFRWASSTKVWYAKDYTYRREFLNTIATQGEDAGASGKSFAEKFEEKIERAEARQERYEGYADNAQAEANRRFETAHTMASAIPMGQPVHGVRDRNYRERIGQNMDKGIEAQDRAEYLAQRAASAGVTLKGYDNPAFLQRRIKECEAEMRRLERNKHHYSSELDNWQRYYDEAKSKCDFCKERLAELGGITYGPDNIHKADLVHCNGSIGLVRRVNKKTVTVDYLDPQMECLYLLKSVPFEDIKKVIPADEARKVLEESISKTPNSPTAIRTRKLLDGFAA